MLGRRNKEEGSSATDYVTDVRKREEGIRKREEGRRNKEEGKFFFFLLPTANWQLATANCQLPTANRLIPS